MLFDTFPRFLGSTYVLFFPNTFTLVISKTNRVHYTTIFWQPFKQVSIFIFYLILIPFSRRI